MLQGSLSCSLLVYLRADRLPCGLCRNAYGAGRLTSGMLTKMCDSGNDPSRKMFTEEIERRSWTFTCYVRLLVVADSWVYRVVPDFSF